MKNVNELTPNERSTNLMMHAAYWKEKYEDSISDLITHENKQKIDAAISEAVVYLKGAREKMHSIEYAGGEHTIGVFSIYQEIDKLMARCTEIQKKVNKSGYRIEDLSIYPID